MDRVKVKRKVNIPRVIWVVCLFLLLIVILLMVMDYKINYEYLEHNEIYFYNCDGELCVTDVISSDKELYSSYDCGYAECPKYIGSVNDDYVLLMDDEKTMLYQYKLNKVISDDYDNYEFIDSNYIIVLDNDLFGIIDTSNKVVVKPSYEEIGIHNNGVLSGYSVNSIVAKKNDRYGLISYRDGKLVQEFSFTDDNLEELVSILQKDK